MQHNYHVLAWRMYQYYFDRVGKIIGLMFSPEQ